MAEGPSGSGFFGFIDILKGLPVVPKIIMFVGLLALIAGFFSGPFALFHNPKISAGAALMLASLSWRDWERSRASLIVYWRMNHATPSLAPAVSSLLRLAP